jgi:dolichol-phosphate mannosyltransferase
MNELDIIIPVYNESENIIPVLNSLKQHVRTPFRVLICYDSDDDNSLPAVRLAKDKGFNILLVKNRSKGAHSAVTTGFERSDAPAILVFTADDTYNAGIIDQMYEKFKQGSDIVAASRFMKGGCMEGCPFLKSFLVRAASFSLYWFASIPIKDASSGFRLFSRRSLDTIKIESTKGFTYSIELLMKCHRLKWKISEVPALWYERTKGRSRFRTLEWLPDYLRWYIYGFATTYLRRSPETVELRKSK